MRPNALAKIFNYVELPDHLAQVEQRMVDLVSAANPIITQPMMRLIKGLDKRFAMFLVLPVVKSQGKPIDESVIASCAALELLSMAFCIHDDVTDNSNRRYGVANINAIEGANQAILIGDFIMNLAIQESLAIGQPIADVVIQSIAENRESEIIEVADRDNLERSVESYLNCIELKTASHFSASSQVGALCAGLDGNQVKAFGEYGGDVGMTYQLIDDLLDFVSTEAIMGKPVGKDVEEGVYTLPLLLALEGPHKNQIEAILKSPEDISELVKILISSGTIEKTIQEIRNYNNLAAEALEGFEVNDVLKGLARYPANYLDLILESPGLNLRGLVK